MADIEVQEQPSVDIPVIVIHEPSIMEEVKAIEVPEVPTVEANADAEPLEIEADKENIENTNVCDGKEEEIVELEKEPEVPKSGNVAAKRNWLFGAIKLPGAPALKKPPTNQVDESAIHLDSASSEVCADESQPKTGDDSQELTEEKSGLEETESKPRPSSAASWFLPNWFQRKKASAPSAEETAETTTEAQQIIAAPSNEALANVAITSKAEETEENTLQKKQEIPADLSVLLEKNPLTVPLKGGNDHLLLVESPCQEGTNNFSLIQVYMSKSCVKIVSSYKFTLATNMRTEIKGKGKPTFQLVLDGGNQKYTFENEANLYRTYRQLLNWLVELCPVNPAVAVDEPVQEGFFGNHLRNVLLSVQ